MLDTLTPAEFDEWLAYAEIEPFGEERADLRSALAASAAVNTWGGSTRPADFMPFTEFDPFDWCESSTVMAAKLEQIVTLNNLSQSRSA